MLGTCIQKLVYIFKLTFRRLALI